MRAIILARACGLYLILACLLLWPLPLSLTTSVINAGDPLFYAWNLAHNWYAFTGNMHTLLDTNLYYPTTNTLAFSDTLFAQTVLTAPILWLTHNPILAENLYTWLTFPVAGLGMMLLAYYVTKHTASSVLAGLFYAFSSPRLGQISHMPAISSQWFPFMLLFLLRYASEGKNRDIALYFLFLLLLATSTMYFFVFGVVASLVVIAGYTGIYVRRGQLKTLLHRMLHALPWSVVFLFFFILVNYPYIRLKAENPDIRRSIEEAAVFAAYQHDYASVLPTSLLYRNILRTQEGERTLFPTLTILVLLFASLRFAKQWKKETVLIACIGAVALILSFGPSRPFQLGPFDTGYLPLPYKFAYKVFPLLQIIRVPARFSILVTVATSLLSAVALATIKTKKYTTVIFSMIGLLFLLEVWQVPQPLVSIPSYGSIPAVYQWVKQQNNAKLVELPVGRIESGKTPIQDQVKKSLDTLTIDDPLATEAYRVYFAGYHLKTTANGYSGFIPTSYHETVDAMGSFPSDESLAFLARRGILHIIVHLWQYKEEDRERIKQAITTNPRLRIIAQFNDDYVVFLIADRITN